MYYEKLEQEKKERLESSRFKVREQQRFFYGLLLGSLILAIEFIIKTGGLK